MSFTVRGGRCPDRHAQRVLFGVDIFGVRGGESGFQWLSVFAPENADIDIRSLDLRQIGFLRVGVAAPEFLEHHRTHSHGAGAGGSGPAFLRQFRHDA